jgi:geranylgeranyl diphosphate synthase type II
MSHTQQQISEELGSICQQVKSRIAEIFANYTEFHPRLKESMQYMLSGGGKRVRPAVVMFSCELVSSKVNEQALDAGVALEMVHTYSLIHDDLPAMDDDDYRRARPSCHKAFDEATAILAGDGLLTFAFEYLSDVIGDNELCVKLISQLARAAGAGGMIAGQMADLQAENQQIDREKLEYIHINKTAKMFECAAVMGGLCADADKNQLRCLSEYGLNLGLGFQVADDILDISASTEQLGKTAGKDEIAGKFTYPALVGLEKSRQIEEELAGKAVKALGIFGQKTNKLSALAKMLIERTS